MSFFAVSAGALFVDEQGRVLLVEPTYKSYWDVPGGYVEPGESPLAACAREVARPIRINSRPVAGPSRCRQSVTSCRPS